MFDFLDILWYSISNFGFNKEGFAGINIYFEESEVA